MESDSTRLADLAGIAAPDMPAASPWLLLDAVPKDTVIEVERLGCFWCCSEYTVSVDNAGTVSFNGARYVATMGERTRVVPESTVLELLHIAGESGFDEVVLDDREQQCGNDGETVRTRVVADGVENEVWRYDCQDPFRETIREFENQVLDALASPEWLEHSTDACSE